MKIALFGFTDIKLGKHNLKDPRLINWSRPTRRRTRKPT
jgi:hypothetical protein